MFGRLSGREADRLVAWGRERAIPLDLSDPTESGQRLAALDPLLADRRIAFLGEANHFVHEKYLVREAVLRWLRPRGFGVVGEELSSCDGRRVERYLQTRDEDELSHVTAFGYAGGRRGDRDDAPRGALRDLLERHPSASFRAEHCRFAALLLALGVRFFGYDVDYEPGAGYELLPEGLRERLARVPDETLEQEVERLRIATAELRESDALLAWQRRARTTWRSHEYLRLLYDAPRLEDVRPAMALREEIMAEHVRDVLSELRSDERLVLLGHDMHLARDDDAIRSSRGAVGPGGNLAPSLGARVHAEHPGDVFAIWMLHGGGSDASPVAGGGAHFRAPRGSLNEALCRVGRDFALPLRDEDPDALVLQRPLPIAMNSGLVVRTPPARQADALVFVRDVEPLRL